MSDVAEAGAAAGIETPRDEADLAALIRDADGPLGIVGHASKAAMLRPVEAGRTVSTRAISGITLYAPKELIISARAGTPLSEVETALAGGGQQLTAEPPDFGRLLGSNAPQTIGGIVAANLSGSRRVAWGATRDHVMGVRAVNGTGEVIRSGGRVLKNVTGLDLCKLLAGSHGTLGVLTEVTLKVLPVPERTASVVLAGLDPVAGVAALAASLGSPYAVSGAAYLPAEAASLVPSLAWLGGPVAIARIEDFALSVAYRSGRLREDLRAFGAAEILDDTASRAAWTAIRNASPIAGRGDDDAVWRVSVRPSKGPAVAAAVAGIAPRWFMDWGGGLIWLAGPSTPESHEAVCRAVRDVGGTWMLMRGASSLRLSADVVPPEAAALARITRRVKAAFDPRSILNPGRIYASL